MIDSISFLMLSIGSYTQNKVTATPTVHERLNPDSWIAEENDYVNSAYREKRKLIF